MFNLHHLALQPFSLDEILIFMLAPCVNRIEILFSVPNDARYYKIIEMLKHLKLWHLLRYVSVHAEITIRAQSCAWLKLQVRFFYCARRYRRSQCYGGISACCAGVR